VKEVEAFISKVIEAIADAWQFGKCIYWQMKMEAEKIVKKTTYKCCPPNTSP
jgi:hypothetical protein